MRRVLGLAVFSGMLGVTFFGVFLTPVFFYLLRRHGDRAKVAVSREGKAPVRP
jgi:multidrug efflux pump